MDMMDIMDIMDSWHMALCEPCAFKIPQRMAHTTPSTNRPTSPTSPTSPTFFALSIGSAQCSTPANRTHCHVPQKFHSAWHTLHQPSTFNPEAREPDRATADHMPAGATRQPSTFNPEAREPDRATADHMPAGATRQPSTFNPAASPTFQLDFAFF